MTITRCLLLGLILVLPVEAQSPSAKSQAVFKAGQLEKRCASHFARYERFKSTDRLRNMGSSGRVEWVDVTLALRRELSMALGPYLAALDAGWKGDDAELKQARATLEQMSLRMEKCGVWTCFRWEDPRLSDGARDALDKIRAKAWEATLLAEAGQLDKAADALQFARKLLAEMARDVEKALDDGRKVEDPRQHPAHARTVAEVDRLEGSVKGDLANLQGTRDQLKKDTEALAAVVEEVRNFLRSIGSLDYRSGTEDRMIAAAEQLAGKLDGFEGEIRGRATAMLESFKGRYGADRDAIVASIKKIMGSRQLDVPHSPQSLFESLERDLKEVERARSDAGREMIEIAKRNAATKAVDADRREQSFGVARRCLEVALKLDAANRDAQELQGSLGAGAAAADEKAEAIIDAGTWEPHSSRFQGPGDADDLAESARKWLAGDAGWTKDKDLLAVRVNGDWLVAKKNILGKTTNWGLPIEAAFLRHKDRDADRDVAWVYTLTMVTREAEQAPPWESARVGSNRRMRASKVSAPGAAGKGPGTVPRLLLAAALLCSGLLLAGPFLTTKVAALGPVVGMLRPIRPMIGVAALVIGLVFLISNLLSPLSDLLPQAAAIVAGLFLGLELLLKKPARLATAEGDDLTNKAGRKVDAAVEKTQEFLAKHQQSVKKIEKYQIPLGILCLVLALLHLVGAGATFL
ncbi:MAG: hypothetical protein ACYS0K_15315 [Planctomycetota bacterium]|jgi:hypothetical protein